MGFSNFMLIKIVGACFVSLAALFTVSLIGQSQPNNHTKGPAESRDFQVIADKVDPVLEPDSYAHTSDKPKDKLLGGLLSAGFNEASCLSRYGSILYRKLSPHKPSPYLISKLRNYESLHKQCGIDTGARVQYVRHCEDISWGIKLF